MLRLLIGLLGATLLLTGCGRVFGSSGDDSTSEDTPKAGQCRLLEPADVARATNSGPPVDCRTTHTAETFVVSEFSGALAQGSPDDQRLGAAVYDTCQEAFSSYVGGTESLVLRSLLTWAWFRPTDEAWKKGARWFRCDVIGGGGQSRALVNLPRTAKGLLLGVPDDRWMVCGDGVSVASSAKIPCAQPHTWRAVTTIVLGKSADGYPGDRLVEVRTRDYCSDSVGAWMNYPVEYDYGYTWFHEAEWKAGNRRSICWAKTDQ